jgi:hypothetical protein
MGIRKITVSTFVLMLVSIAFITLLGFDYFKHSIPRDDISDGGPSKDRIPFIDNPRFLTVEKADQSLIRNEDIVCRFVHNGQARLYPHQNFELVWYSMRM